MEFWGNFNREVALAVLGIHLMMMMMKVDSSFEKVLFCLGWNKMDEIGSIWFRMSQIGSIRIRINLVQI